MLRGRTRRYAVKAVLHACCAVLIASVPTVASAESLRCNGQSVSEGDTRLALRYSCGEPLLADTYCAPVYYAPTFQPVPEPFASIVVPCQLVEEWLYDRGPGLLMAVVRIRAGVVQSIHYGRSPPRRSRSAQQDRRLGQQAGLAVSGVVNVRSVPGLNGMAVSNVHDRNGANV